MSARDSLHALTETRSLIQLAVVDAELARELALLLDQCAEADWPNAEAAAQQVRHRLRVLTLQTRCDAEGVVRHG